MNVQSGSRLGPYEIVAPVAAGGMGEVYRARDTRLDRIVAIKILSQLSPRLRERFEREARTISSLSHPHICALFDVGHQDGIDYLVMEFLDGESLADRLSRGPLPIEQVLRCGIQIAIALHAAHRSGVVHRDLKPGNVILTKSGAKLLDFGLAKSVAEDAGAGSTLHKPLTEEGTLLGTVPYMAPEQLEGKEADSRTDIFALGATLYEMATGKRAFEGKSRASLIASILDREPTPISQLQPLTPPAFERVVRLCMAKDPDERWQSAHDVAAELRWIADGTSSSTAIRPSRAMPRRVLWGIVGVVAGLAIGAAAVRLIAPGRTQPPAVARFAVALPPDAPVSFAAHVILAISPDGSRFVYSARSGDKRQLYGRTLGELAPRPIAGTEGAITAAFSEDGRSLAFSTSSKLKKVLLDGGVPVTLGEVSDPALGIRWSGDTIYYVPTFNLGVYAVPDSGGAARVVVPANPERGMRALVFPDVLPDGKTLIATVWNNGSWDDAKIVAFPLGGGEPKLLIDGGMCARYVAGYLFFGRGGSLYAVPFDPSSLRTGGPPARVLSGVSTGVYNGEVQYAVSSNGTLLYIAGGVLNHASSLVWIDRHGKETKVVPTDRPYLAPSLSPDGRTIAVTLQGPTFDIWQLDIDRDALTRVSFGGDDSRPKWTPDGRRILWTSSRLGHQNLFWAAADSSESEKRLTNSPHEQFLNDVTPDGQFAVITERAGDSSDLMVVSLTADHTAKPLLATPYDEREASLSPDGKWFLYISNESGRDEAYVRRFGGAAGKWQVSINGAGACKWTHREGEVMYGNGDDVYMVSLTLTPQVHIGKPQIWMRERAATAPFQTWELSADDQKVLWVAQEPTPPASELQVVLNWFEDLKRRVPAR